MNRLAFRIFGFGSVIISLFGGVHVLLNTTSIDNWRLWVMVFFGLALLLAWAVANQNFPATALCVVVVWGSLLWMQIFPLLFLVLAIFATATLVSGRFWGKPG